MGILALLKRLLADNAVPTTGRDRVSVAAARRIWLETLPLQEELDPVWPGEAALQAPVAPPWQPEPNLPIVIHKHDGRYFMDRES